MIQITFLRDLQGNEHAITAVKKIHSEVNGDEDIQLTIHKQKNSRLDLKEVSEMWTIEHDNIEYKIVLVEQKTQGNGFYLDVRGIPLFYDKFRTSVIHYLYNGSVTATNCFTRIFEGTGYNFVLVNPSYAVEWEGFGKGQTRMELFKKALERYGYEFYIQGSTVYMEHQIGNETNFEYRYKMNASNVKRATDATAMITHIKGFGNLDDGEEDYLNNAKLKREATSPLADIIGVREGSPVVDGRITSKDTMDERLQRAIDDSLLISVEASLHDIRHMGYDVAVPLKGDKSFLVDERIGLDTDIRVQSVTTTKDEKDRIIACDVVFGNESIRNRYKANLSTISKNMADLLAGKIQLPFDVLEGMAKDMLLKIQSVDSELLLDNGIFAIDKANPNNILGLNSAGIYISTDGGNTAPTVISADGIVANAITSGQILTHLVRVVGTEGLFSIDGDVATWTSANDTDIWTEIRPSGVTTKGTFTNIRPDAYIDSNGKKFGYQMEDGVPNIDMDIDRDLHLTPDATDRTETRYVLHGQGIAQADTPYSVERFYTSHKAKFITAGIGLALEGSYSSYITVDIIEIGGSVVASTRRFVRSSESTAWYNLTFEVGVPDFSSRIAYYIRISSSVMGSATRALLTVNRVWLWG